MSNRKPIAKVSQVWHAKQLSFGRFGEVAESDSPFEFR